MRTSLQGLRINALPSAFDLVDQRVGNCEIFGDGHFPMSRQKTPSNLHDIGVAEFGVRVLFTPKVNKPSAPLVRRIFRQRAPLQVFWAIVCLVAILVIDARSRKFTGHKSSRNQAVNKHLRAAWPNLLRNCLVSAVIQPRRYVSRLLPLSGRKAITDAVFDNFWDANAAKVGNQKRGSLFFNFAPFFNWGHA